VRLWIALRGFDIDAPTPEKRVVTRGYRPAHSPLEIGVRQNV